MLLLSPICENACFTLRIRFCVMLGPVFFVFWGSFFAKTVPFFAFLRTRFGVQEMVPILGPLYLLCMGGPKIGTIFWTPNWDGKNAKNTPRDTKESGPAPKGVRKLSQQTGSRSGPESSSRPCGVPGAARKPLTCGSVSSQMSGQMHARNSLVQSFQKTCGEAGKVEHRQPQFPCQH